MTGPEPDDRLGRALDRAASNHCPAATPTEAIASVRARARRRHVVRRATSLGAGVAVVLVMAAGVVVAWPTGSDRSEIRTDQPTTIPPAVSTTAPPPVPDPEPDPDPNPGPERLPAGFRELPPPPLEARDGGATAWIGEELVLWGGALEEHDLGFPTYADGAVFDPATEQWRLMSPSPLPGSNQPPHAAWTGSEVVIVQDGRSAAWDPATDRWRELSGFPQTDPLDLLDVAVIGSQVIAVGPDVSLDPGATEWRPLPAPPTDLAQGTAVAGEDEVLVTGTTVAPGGRAGDLIGMAYDPDDGRWRELPPSGLDAQAVGTTWTGQELVAVNYDMTAAAYDPRADRWRDLPDLPLRFGECSPSVHALAEVVVAAFCGSLAVLEDGAWTPFGVAADLFPRRASDEAIYFLGVTGRGSQPRLALAEFVPPDGEDGIGPGMVARVGTSDLVVPEGFRVQRFEQSVEADGRLKLQTAYLSGPAGECAVESGYYGTFASDRITDLESHPDAEPVRVDPVDGSESFGAVRLEAGRLAISATTSDIVEITCDDDATALTLARHVVSLTPFE